MLELKRVCKFFGNKIVLKNVNLKVAKGEGVVIKGPNGCGKSTLLKIIAGIIPPSQGEVFFKDISKIGYMGHFWGIYPHLTAYENLNFWADIYNISMKKKDLIHLLDKVGLEGYSSEKTEFFSRGMIQKLNFARIMLINPDIYLLDEPETGLDRNAKEIFYSYIKQEIKKNKIVLWVSHDEDVNFFNRALVYNNYSFNLE